MQHIKPHTAALAAQDVYQYREGSDFSKAIAQTNAIFKDEFDFSNSSRFVGNTGGQMFASESGFGIYGRGIGHRDNEAIIIIRGTETVSDWITDASFGSKFSDTGYRVHEGFYKTFKSFQKQLSDQLSKHKRVSTIHLIGHSLGGALAGLTADWLRSSDFKDTITPVVYTFGAPRIACMDFVNNFTKKIKEENIFRVYNRSDPVSMVPSWPFSHYPMPGNGLHVGHTSIVNPLQHKMKHYIKHCDGIDWQSLRNVRNNNTVTDQMVENWLDSGIFHGFNNSFVLMHAAVNYVIEKAFKFTGVNALANLSDSFTAIDKLAYSLEKISKASKEMSGLVKKLMQRILMALGHQFNVDINLSASFIKWVLESMTNTINNKVRVALNIPN